LNSASGCASLLDFLCFIFIASVLTPSVLFFYSKVRCDHCRVVVGGGACVGRCRRLFRLRGRGRFRCLCVASLVVNVEGFTEMMHGSETGWKKKCYMLYYVIRNVRA
jgi:hypothetical protein